MSSNVFKYLKIIEEDGKKTVREKDRNDTVLILDLELPYNEEKKIIISKFVHKDYPRAKAKAKILFLNILNELIKDNLIKNNDEIATNEREHSSGIPRNCSMTVEELIQKLKNEQQKAKKQKAEEERKIQKDKEDRVNAKKERQKQKEIELEELGNLKDECEKNGGNCEDYLYAAIRTETAYTISEAIELAKRHGGLNDESEIIKKAYNNLDFYLRYGYGYAIGGKHHKLYRARKSSKKYKRKSRRSQRKSKKNRRRSNKKK